LVRKKEFGNLKSLISKKFIVFKKISYIQAKQGKAKRGNFTSSKIKKIKGGENKG